MKFLIVLVVFVAATHAATLQEQWQEFKLEHGKTYKSLLEEKRRFAIFQDNLREIEEHNEKFAKGEQSYSMGINQFSDMTQEEFEATLTEMPAMPEGIPREVFNDTGIFGNENINWVSRGWVTPVKNQGACGSCWAFSAAGAIEGQAARAGRGLVNLSPQNLMDCSRNGNNKGCNGGLMDYAFQYVQRNGILTEAEYPYQARQMACHKQGGLRISGYVDVPHNENSLLSALSSAGPISIGIEANRLKPYRGGIFDARSGCRNQPNHGVLLVGAGSENGQNYWLVKNSWGPGWGMNGYFKIARGSGACGINTMNSYPRL